MNAFSCEQIKQDSAERDPLEKSSIYFNKNTVQTCIISVMRRHIMFLIHDTILAALISNYSWSLRMLKSLREIVC